MKILIISHNVISKTGSMGKTIRSYFENFTQDEFAQFYIQAEKPTDISVCKSYYRFTDQDALKSLFSFRQRGKKYREENIMAETNLRDELPGVVSNMYRYGKKKNEFVYLARNVIWGVNRWKTKEFEKWVKEFDPDIVFFMSGDYAFLYKIAVYVARIAACPLAIMCVDDYYANNINKKSWMGRYLHNSFMGVVRKTMKHAMLPMTISESMGKEYEKIFSVQFKVLHTSAKEYRIASIMNNKKISYVGNLAYGRNTQLIALGKAIKETDIGFIDVYSGQQDPAMTMGLTEENGIRFHGSISADEVLKVMENSMAVIHTESFEPDMQAMTRFSVSTKIAESLMYGPCLIAYGPEGIASIDYLKENQAAYVITSPEDLQSGLEEIIGNAELRQQIVANARALAKKNHDASINSANVRRWLEDAIREYRSGKNEDSSNQQCV